MTETETPLTQATLSETEIANELKEGSLPRLITTLNSVYDVPLREELFTAIHHAVAEYTQVIPLDDLPQEQRDAPLPQIAGVREENRQPLASALRSVRLQAQEYFRQVHESRTQPATRA